MTDWKSVLLLEYGTHWSSWMLKPRRRAEPIVISASIVLRSDQKEHSQYSALREAVCRGSQTSLYFGSRLEITLVPSVVSWKRRKGRIRMKIERRGIARIASSNRRVKSKPPRHWPAQGPNVLSIKSHVGVVGDCILGP